MITAIMMNNSITEQTPDALLALQTANAARIQLTGTKHTGRSTVEHIISIIWFFDKMKGYECWTFDCRHISAIISQFIMMVETRH